MAHQYQHCECASNITEVFDPEFKYVKEVPNSVVRHTPPSRLNITRLVFCRNYRPFEPSSCTMGSNCKFVHADIDPETLPSHPIHVKYSWRHESLCTYERLPAGETLRVTAPNNRPPIEEIPSERILLTRGSMLRKDSQGPLSHCAHYFFNRMCNRGERCGFIHAVHVDPNVQGDFKRAPARCVVTAPRSQRTSGIAQRVFSDATRPAEFKALSLGQTRRIADMYEGLSYADDFKSMDSQFFVLPHSLPTAASNGSFTASTALSSSFAPLSACESSGQDDITVDVSDVCAADGKKFRRNPYSLREVTVAA